MYNANRCGDNTPPCLIRQVNLNERDNTGPHLTQVILSVNLQQINRNTSVQWLALSYTIFVTMAALCLANVLARTSPPTTNPDFPLSLLFKPLLPSNGTAPWKRHSLTGLAYDVSATSPLPTDIHIDYILRSLFLYFTTNIPITPWMLPTVNCYTFIQFLLQF